MVSTDDNTNGRRVEFQFTWPLHTLMIGESDRLMLFRGTGGQGDFGVLFTDRDSLLTFAKQQGVLDKSSGIEIPTPADAIRVLETIRAATDKVMVDPYKNFFGSTVDELIAHFQSLGR